MKTVLKRFAAVLGVVLLGLIAYLMFWPVPIEPVAWPAPTATGFVGVFATNTRLSNLRTIDIGEEHGPEHIVLGPDGKLYAAMTSGNVIRMDPDGSKREVFVNTGGVCSASTSTRRAR